VRDLFGSQNKVATYRISEEVEILSSEVPEHSLGILFSAVLILKKKNIKKWVN
jgi:predicted alpha/beta-hydrolase family hydrolase